MHFDSLSILDDTAALEAYNHLMAELLAHARGALDAKLAFAALFEPGTGSRIHVTDALDTFQPLPRDDYLVFARNIVRSGANGKGGAADSGPEGTPVGACLFNDRAQPIGAMIFVRPDDENNALQGRLLAMFSQLGSMIVQHQERALALRVSEKHALDSLGQLEDIHQKFGALVSNVPGAIFRYIRNPDGSESIEFMSPGCEAIWEYSADELEGDPSPLWAAVLPEDLKAMQASIFSSEATGSKWQHRWRIRTKSGFLKWLEAYGLPYRTPDGGAAWYTFVLDVTVEQNAQIALAENTRVLHEAQKLESIGRLAGGVAHDFNNLLAVIVGNAEAISKTDLPVDNEEAVREIMEASHRGAVLVKQLLSFARKSDLRATVTDVREVLGSIDSLMRRVLPANISLEVVHRAGMWPVKIDREMFESALLNIVINARDAMPNGGAITIETSNERVDHDYIVARDEDARPGRYVMVAVTDTGRGIDETALPLVFEPFFSTKDPSAGTGMGLAMVQGFVKQSKGIVRVYSEQRHGTSIKMYFPAAEQNVQTPEFSDGGVPKETFPATVLLVEDQEGVRRVIEKTLSSAGYRVISTASGDEAIDVYQQRNDDIDVIVTDVVMPGTIQGPQFVRLARKINHNVPALYMSGYPHEANIHGNGIRAGDISLLKPVRRSDLLTAVARLLRQP